MDGDYDPKGRRSAPPYPTMSVDEIGRIKLPAKEDCVLWLWVINNRFRNAFNILDQWGFKEKNILTWVKDKFGLGAWLRNQTEHCILSVRGKPYFDARNISTLLHGKRTSHSVKPDSFYALVEKTCAGEKLDYFARRERKGWVCFGDEVK